MDKKHVFGARNRKNKARKKPLRKKRGVSEPCEQRRLDGSSASFARLFNGAKQTCATFVAVLHGKSSKALQS